MEVRTISDYLRSSREFFVKIEVENIRQKRLVYGDRVTTPKVSRNIIY